MRVETWDTKIAEEKESMPSEWPAIKTKASTQNSLIWTFELCCMLYVQYKITTHTQIYIEKMQNVWMPRIENDEKIWKKDGRYWAWDTSDIYIHMFTVCSYYVYLGMNAFV